MKHTRTLSSYIRMEWHSKEILCLLGCSGARVQRGGAGRDWTTACYVRGGWRLIVHESETMGGADAPATARRPSGTASPNIDHLSLAQQQALEPHLHTLGRLATCAAVASCCTICISWIPYAMKTKQVLRMIESMERENSAQVDSDTVIIRRYLTLIFCAQLDPAGDDARTCRRCNLHRARITRTSASRMILRILPGSQ